VARELVPRIVVFVLLAMGAFFSYAESLYLRDQSSAIGQNGGKIVLWLWVFRVTTAVLAFGAMLILANTTRRFLG
jgi:hypothetical protein